MINSYQLLEDGEKLGPFTLNELLDREPSADSLVLSPLHPDWQNAGELPELHPYFREKGIYYPTATNLAGFGPRLAAFLIDFILSIVIPIVLFTFIYGFVQAATGDTVYSPDDDGPWGDFLYRVLYIAMSTVYYTLCECSKLQGSIGKSILGMVVVDTQGNRLSFAQAGKRNLSRIVSGMFLSIGYLMVLWNPRKQALHDQWAHTVVVKKNK